MTPPLGHRTLHWVAGMGTLHKSMLVLTLVLLICEVVLSRVCNTIINLVDGFHTLFILMHMALPANQTTGSSSSSAKEASHKCTHANSNELSPSSSHRTQPENTTAYPTCGLSYTHMRIHTVVRMVSALLLGSLCVSICLEILSHTLQPHPIRHPLAATLVGAGSLLHNLLVLGLGWGQLGYSTGPATGTSDTVKIKDQTKVLTEPRCARDHLDKSLSADGGPFHNVALVLCNPGTSCDIDTDTDIQYQSHGAPQPHEEVCLPTAIPQGSSSPGSCHTSQSRCGDSDGLALERQDREVPEQFSGNLRIQSRSGQSTASSKQSCLTLILSVIHALSSPILALTNALVLLLVIPELLHSSWSCSMLVYLDPGFSLLAVIVLLTLAVPQIYRCGLLLLQTTPPLVCMSDLERRIVSVPGVYAVHELHIWQLTDTYTVASVHIHCHTEFQMHRFADVTSGVVKVLQREGVSCCTVQPEFLISTLATNGSTHHKDGRDVPASLLSTLTCSLACKKACAGRMCCSPLVEDAGKPLVPSAGKPEEEPQVLIIENTLI